MLCDRCKIREATIYYTQTKDGNKTEQHLCEVCASELTKFRMKSALSSREMSLGGLLASIFGSLSESQDLDREAKENVTECKVCGMTYDTFILNGRFGCSACYTHFEKQLEKSLRQIQGATAHIGKRPKGFVSKTQRIISELSEVERLSIKLQDAIEKEEFEEAARLRDLIRDHKAKEAN